jgi:hypothetical protein
MKTPYDGYVRMQKRSVDSIRIAISVNVTKAEMLDHAASKMAATVRQECASASENWAIPTYDYLRARQREASLIAQDRAACEADIDRLRQQASDAYGALRVAEEAAQRHRVRIIARANRAQQAEADDLSSARMLLRARRQAAAQKSGQ